MICRVRKNAKSVDITQTIMVLYIMLLIGIFQC